MIDATLLMTGPPVYSPWFPRQADILRVVAECVAVNGGILVIKLYTKNIAEVGDGLPVDDSVMISLSSPGRSAVTEWKTVTSQEGVEQLLRFRYEVTGTLDPDSSWILFRLLPACWFDSVAVA